MRTKKDFDKQNDYNRKNYDRVGLMLPKGKGDEWRADAKARAVSLNALIISAVEEYLQKNCTIAETTVQKVDDN